MADQKRIRPGFAVVGPITSLPCIQEATIRPHDQDRVVKDYSKIPWWDKRDIYRLNCSYLLRDHGGNIITLRR